MGRKRPHPSSDEADATFPRVGKERESPSAADLAYDHAVEVCNRIIRELDEILLGGKA